MAVPDEIRGIVQDIVDGAHGPAALMTLFLWLRRLTGGAAPEVKDIGDFVAHRDEKDRGVTWRRGLDFCFVAAKIAGQLPHTSEALLDALLASLEGLGPKESRRIFGVPHKTVKAHLKSALAKASSFDGRKPTFLKALSLQEKAVFDFFWRSRGWRPAITQDKLIAELTDYLLKKGALLPSEKDKFLEQAEAITVFALAQMHQTSILYKGASIASLFVWPGDGSPDCLSVKAHISFLPKTSITGEIVTTSCRMNKWCDPSLAPKPLADLGNGIRLDGFGAFDGPLKLDGQGRLVPIVIR